MSERSEWLEQRQKGIGGSDVSAILLQNPWRTPLDVWLEKMGRGETWEVEPERVKWGRILEPAIAQGYAEDMQLDPDELYSPGLLTHPLVDCVLGTPDRMHRSTPRGLEIKAVNPFAKSEYGEPGTDIVPDHYHLQADHYLFLTDRAEWDLAVLFGGQRLDIFTVRRNFKLDGIIAEASAKFWRDYVVADRTPPVDDTERYGKFLAQTFRNSTSKYFPEPTEAFLEWLERARESKRVTNLAKQVAQEARNHISEILGACAGMKAPDGSKAMWIRPKPAPETDWEALVKHCMEKAVQPDAELVKSFTKTKERSAYLRVTFTDDEENEGRATEGTPRNHSAQSITAP